MNEKDLQELTKGNQYAADFIVAYVAFCHLIDDLWDKDKEVTDRRMVTELMLFLEQVIMNPWVKEHVQSIWPLIVAGANSWLDSNTWEKDGVERKRQ